MKKIITYILSPILCYLGMAVAKVMEMFSLWFLYCVYNWLMTSSSRLEDWAGMNFMWDKVNISE